MDPAADRLRILAETSHAFAEATPSVDRLLDTIAERCSTVIGDGCYIRLLAPDGIELLPVATRHPDPDTERYLRATTDGVPLKVGEGISGRVVLTGESALLPEISFEQYRKLTKPEFADRFERLGISSMVVVRLAARGTNLGFLALVRNGVGRPPYTEEDLHLLEDLADRAAMAIDNARLLASLESRVRERTNELETANAEARAANAELEAFSYSVSHDLRAPLRAIDGYAQILEEDFGPALDDEGHRLVGIIRGNANRMAQLIDDLLRFSRLGRHEIDQEPVSMDSLARGVVENVLAVETSRIFDVRVGALPPANGDRNLLHQVWVNIIGNAVKYSRPRSIAVIEIEGTVDEDEIRYTVKDNGVGFDPKYKHKLFCVFQRLHGQTEFEGTGVGLALVQRIVLRHGGRVWAEAVVDEGATFGFALPR